MVVLRVVAGSLLWILAVVVALLGALLSVTIILLPLGVPLLFLARRLFRYSVALVVPRAVRHPVQEVGESARQKAGQKLGRKDRSLLGRAKRAI